jgi:thioredoxin reductase/ferredoxin
VIGVSDPMTLAAIVVGAGVGGALVVHALVSRRRARRHEAIAARSERLGHTEPVSLHPKIDEHACICTGACVSACPEKDVIGFVDGRPALIKPTACIGHGECMRACPVGAISLVIGSERRGVDLPLVGVGGRDFQTNVPGLFIAGELGGMGLIHNAVTQGVQAMKSIAASLPRDPADGDDRAGGGAVGGVLDVLDVLVVGAGPAGLAAALQAKQSLLRFAIVDQEELGGALRSFPRQKIVMTAPVEFPIYGKVTLRRTTKEALLELWREIVDQTGIRVEAGVKVEGVRREGGLFTVETSAGPRRARAVLLAIGRRGTPRKLGIPGETLEKVTYRLLEPEQYRGARCLVVGGGDSAVETALTLARERGTKVTLVHRGDTFDRVKPDNFDALEAARRGGALTVRTRATPVEITPDAVRVRIGEGPAEERIDNDFVFVCAGGELPTAWLAKIGVEVRTVRGEAFTPGVAVRS